MAMHDDELVFADEAADGGAACASVPAENWRVFIIDDDPYVHDVTRLALHQFQFEGRGITFLHAYSGEEARTLLAQESDIGVALVDVVMETDHAGLDLVRHIREERGDRLMRIILRTGQPGQAPERRVIADYDINDYKEKTELTAQRLYSAVLAALRAYRDLIALEGNRRGLQRVIQASAEVFRIKRLTEFIQGVMDQLLALLYLEQDALYLNRDGVLLERNGAESKVIAASGRFRDWVGQSLPEKLPEDLGGIIARTFEQRAGLAHGGYCTAYFSPEPGREDVLVFRHLGPLRDDDWQMIQLFCQNAAIAYHNVLLAHDIQESQREIVFMLGETVETRSQETGQHVRRVAEYCRCLGRAYGLPEADVERLWLAAPLHDFGKIGIPDRILNKPGKLDAEEWAIMQTHAAIGGELLARSAREAMQWAAVVARTHHERWDGQGYPAGLAGEAIPIAGRMAAIADVYDALTSRRCYKEPWPLERVYEYLQEQRGRQFDPQLVDLFMSVRGEMEAIRERFPD